MAAPIVIPQGENPINNALQYAGKAIRDSIGLMNQAKQIQVMQEQNRVEAGKALLANNWNMFESLSKDLGPELAWEHTRNGFDATFEILGMPATNRMEFQRAMTSGPVSVQGMRILSLNRLTKGTFADQPAGEWVAAQEAQATAIAKASAESQAATPAEGGTTSTAGKAAISWDDWISVAPDKPVPGKPSAPTSTKPALQPPSAGDVNAIGAAVAAKKQVTDVLTNPPIVTPPKPSPYQPGSSPMTGQLFQKVEKTTTLIGPAMQFKDAADREAFVKTRTLEYSQTGGMGPASARILAEAAADIKPIVTTTKGAPASKPVSPAAPPLTYDSRPPNWKPGLEATPAWRTIKPAMDPTGTLDTETVKKGYKGFYEYWTRDVAGINTPETDARVGKAVSEYINATPSLADRFGPEQSRNYIASFDPSGKGDFAAGAKRFQDSFNLPQFEAETGRQNANTSTRDERAMNDPNLGVIWRSQDPITKQWNGQKVSIRQAQVLVQQADVFMRGMAAQGEGNKLEGEIYTNARKNIEARDAEFMAIANKEANDFDRAKKFNALQQTYLESTSGSSYKRDRAIADAYEKSWGFVPMEGKGKELNYYFRGPLGHNWFALSSTASPISVMVPPDAAQDQTSGTTQPNSSQSADYIKKHGG